MKNVSPFVKLSSTIISKNENSNINIIHEVQNNNNSTKKQKISQTPDPIYKRDSIYKFGYSGFKDDLIKQFLSLNDLENVLIQGLKANIDITDHIPEQLNQIIDKNDVIQYLKSKIKPDIISEHTKCIDKNNIHEIFLQNKYK